MKQKVYFRANGGAVIGYGHLSDKGRLVAISFIDQRSTYQAYFPTW